MLKGGYDICGRCRARLKSVLCEGNLAQPVEELVLRGVLSWCDAFTPIVERGLEAVGRSGGCLR